MRRLVQVLAIAVAVLAVATLASYLFGFEPLRRWLDPPMALNTGLCILALSFAVAFLGRERDGK